MQHLRYSSSLRIVHESGAILTEKIDGKYWMYWLGTSRDHKDEMGLSHSYDVLHWTEATEIPALPARPENSILASSSPAHRRFSRLKELC
jgi:hypothetical protein